MLTNTILQNTLDSVYAIAGCGACVYSVDGILEAKSLETPMDSSSSVFTHFVDSSEEVAHIGAWWFFKVYSRPQTQASGQAVLEYILTVEDSAQNASEKGRLLVFQLESLLSAYQDRFDKDNYIKNLLLDNMLLVDIYSNAKRLQIDQNAPRAIFYIECENAEKDNCAALHEIIRGIFPSRDTDFVTSVDDAHLILVKDVSEDSSEESILHIAETINDTVGSELMSPLHVAIGSVSHDIKELSRSYKEAKVALEVGRIFYPQSRVIAFNNLGIGRLIYQLPISFCRLFLDEILKNDTLEALDEVDFQTINCFFENNLIVSETARQLFCHRNTLVYRLNKLERITNLDIRNFDDAITFKIALMVSQYIKYIEQHNEY